MAQQRQPSKHPGTLPRFVKERIDRLRVDLGGPVPISYQEMADRMGMDKGQLSKIVNGRQMVRLDTLQRIAEALSVPLSTLFDGEERPPIGSMGDLINLITAHHQDLLKALAELSPADAAVGPARRLVAAEARQKRPARPKRAR